MNRCLWLIALVLLITGCAVHRYEMSYGIDQQGGRVSSYGRSNKDDLKILYNEKAWSDSLWKAQARHANIEATNESLLVNAYLTGSPNSTGDLQLGVVVNEMGQDHNIRIRGRKKIVCPMQADTLFLRPGKYTLIVDYLDERRRALYTESRDFLVDGIKGNAPIAGMGIYDWNQEIR